MLHLHARGCCGGGTPMATSFQSDYRGVPILFKGLVPLNDAEFAAALCVIGLSAIFFRLLIFARIQLQRNYWRRTGGRRSVLSVVVAESLRALMAIVTAGLGYALMLITMTYVVGYFLAVIIGFGLAELMLGRYFDDCEHRDHCSG